MKHACLCDIQILCHSVEMSALELRRCIDISTSGHHSVNVTYRHAASFIYCQDY